jgi:nicotinamidase-related amidase
VADRYTAPDIARSALITIDTQRDTLDGGALEIPGTSTALEPMGALVRAYRRAGRPIVHVVRIYRSDGSNVDLCRRASVQDGAPILLAGDPGTEPAPELLPDPAIALDNALLLAGEVQELGPREVALYKPRWGAFYETLLEAHLRSQGVDTLVFCGCNFPNCPRTSIYEASERDFKLVLARDAVSGLYERGEAELAAIGVSLLDATEIVAVLAAVAPAAA